MLLAQDGFTVFAGVRREANGQRLQEAAPAILPVLLDITDATQMERATSTIAAVSGRLDGLVNNAGIGVTGPLEYVPLDALRRQFEVNVFGAVAMTQAVLPLLRRAKGRVVNVGSVGSWITMPFGGPLCASKHAIRSINDALRMELRPWDIRVALIEPSSIATPAVDKVEADAARLLEDMGRDGRELYRRRYRTMVDNAVRRERQGSDPSVVARAIRYALTARRPKARYPVGKHSRPMSTMARILPQHTLDALRLRVLGIADTEESHTESHMESPRNPATESRTDGSTP